ncbi:conserved hypothetical protein [Verticillium alfalfae VaMs.102]|uniref:Uncharacterized protein n=1 Tax=Verticillium alfalfae (strain VaMs.102 / ATCC MYA-4576 / FGSC 10136) TaxID=526221 RepID=C9SNQ5_VERA1|nr:conserved hypothetical protein [Verticillium alfalfae VaMs.102]EEY20420.1 conserved hypothetical protein [Verticillium alfalfae VaMs.102]
MSMPGSFSPHAPSSPKMAPTAAASSASTGDVKKPDAFLTPPLRLGESSDAYSLHSTNANAPGRFYDDDPAELPGSGGDDDDLPPLYTDEPSADGVRDPLLQIQDLHSKQHGLVPPHLVVPDTGNEYHIDRRLDADPSFLQRHIEACAEIPPRAFVRLRGTHTEPVRRGDKTERQTHVDFDVRLELTPFLYSDIATHTSWRTLRTADNFAKVRRGTVFATRAPGFGGARAPGGVVTALEQAAPASPSGATATAPATPASKTFQLRREVTGWKRGPRPVQARDAHPRHRLPGPRRRHLSPAGRDGHRLQRRRHEPLAPAALVGTTCGARAVRRAVLERRQGTLDQGDLVAAEGAQDATFEGQTEAQAVVGNAVGNFVRAGVSAMNAVNVRFGWGGDH